MGTFDNNEFKKYNMEAQERWGATDAFVSEAIQTYCEK